MPEHVEGLRVFIALAVLAARAVRLAAAPAHALIAAAAEAVDRAEAGASGVPLAHAGHEPSGGISCSARPHCWRRCARKPSTSTPNVSASAIAAPSSAVAMCRRKL